MPICLLDDPLTLEGVDHEAICFKAREHSFNSEEVLFPGFGVDKHIVNTMKDLFHNLLRKIRAHLSPIGKRLYLYLPKGVMMTQSSWDSSSSSNV